MRVVVRGLASYTGCSMRVEQEIVLPATAVEAWSVLVDWERQADWMRDADKVAVLTAHREGIGVRLSARTRVFNVPAIRELLEVVAWEPPRRLVVAHRRFVNGSGEWRLDPDPGGTRFTWVEDVRLAIPVVGELALRLYRPFLRMLMDRGMRDLRRRLIATGPAISSRRRGRRVVDVQGSPRTG